MVDERVRDAQKFINSYNVSGIPKLEEDGKTSWSVMFALTRALQHELRITALSDTFGPGTLGALQQNYPVIDGRNTHANINRIIGHGLYCKGYSAGLVNGTYNSEMSASVTQLKRDMGVGGVFTGDGVTPKVFKALLTMDPYVLIDGGRSQVRAVQQWLNGNYVGRRDFFIIPCDGYFSRDVQKALLLAIQFQIGMADGVANGVFGPGTRSGIRNNLLSVGSSGTWVSLFTAAMIFNQRDGVVFDSVYTSELAGAVQAFQRFVVLPETGQGDFQTWASLLVSTGDETRRGTALDCVTQITPARAQALRGAGYQVVGRYLSNVPNTTLNKMIQPGELNTIVSNGLRVFPIYQTFGGEAAYFNREQGMADAHAAIWWAKYHGFKPGTRIYFAVDYDALDYQVSDNIIPHFRGIKEVIAEHGGGYQIGIYGPRNVCSRVRAEGLTTASFVCDMSTGFSGNLGFPMPVDWAFDQISTISVGSGDGLIEIDNDIASGRDLGQVSFNPPEAPAGVDRPFDMSMRNAMLRDVQTYLESIDVPETGGPAADVLWPNSTTDAFNVIMKYDGLITELAQTLRMRKAAIQCPLLWEYRKFNSLDTAADAAVIAGVDGDCSTGLAQIFAWVAIDARNQCIRDGIINGDIMNKDNSDHIKAVWNKLHYDPIYNVSTIPLVLIEAARLITLPRPRLDWFEYQYRDTLARYNGTGPKAQEYGRQLIGLFRVFEKYNAPIRGQAQ
ncbi:glycoside hydrolase domain-containing protein [Lentzea sp. NPDC004789]